ncbi:P-loop containing nucleoside triphosphate hydrolase protein [Sodiomyces alkalinus F11]|uniref:P-loop containing nucleoside triphosphate hydrolase protein n=1 Tax=Sodiomyces alkalinus (strain CBS 110278 / VKM F-3762 / F11) TaxID=1314773 RepID=A0A3N2PP76_SODAK|nr:P-loop containing nucleoside triphosphate hydrolase protein [Sodiomyces alkalinus F11]ROT36315.1 P-loop containing nucleoside triphosphate hydrolase protein [Sodiomyces alkalinus F11]
MASVDRGATPGNASWKDLFAFTRRRHCIALIPAVLAAFAVGAFKTSLAVAFGQFFQLAVDFNTGVLSPRDALSEVESLCILLCGLGAGHWAANTAFLSSWVIFGELQARSAREQTFQSLLERDIAWYDGQSDGISSLLVRIETQIRELQLATSQVFGFLISDAFVSIACIAVSFYMSWRLTLVLLATLPISVGILTLATRRLQPAIQAQKGHLAEASKYANSAVVGIDLVKIYNGFDYEVWKYYGSIKASMKQYLVQAHCNAIQMGYAKFWVIGLFAVGFWYGIVLVSQGATAGQILTTFYATLTAFQGIEALMPQWLVLAKGMSAGQALRSTDSVARGSKRRPGSSYRPPYYCAGAVEAHDVSFAYPSNPDQIVLSRSSFVFPTGKTSFIVGRSGSGKSTLGNLLVNFYRPLTGNITIDGYDISSLDDHWLRSNVTLIQQTSVLFNETFFMNIAFGHRSPAEATIDDVKKACDAAVLQSTLAVMPQGLSTMVGPGGYSLSGGQKQRLALARARLRDPPVLILDEVTSGLDPASKALVMEAIRTWRRDKTTIIITHDVSQIRDDDYVFVMDKSRLVQEGTRERIAEQSKGDGLFASLLAATDEEVGLGDDGESMGSPSTPALKRSHSSESLPRWHDRDDTKAGKRRSSIVSDIIARQLEEATPSREYGFGRRHIGSSLGDATVHATFIRTRAIWDDGDTDQRPHHYHRRSTFDGGQSRPWSRPRSKSRARSERSVSRRSSMEMVERVGHHIRRTRIGSTRSRRVRSPLADYEDDGEKRPGTADTGTTDPRHHDRGSDNDMGPPLSLLKLFRTVWSHLAPPERLRLVAGIVLCVIVAVASPLFSYCFAWLLSAFWADTDDRESAGRLWAILLIVIAVVNGLAMWTGRYLMEYAGQAWINALRLEGPKRILRQPKVWFDKPQNSVGRINECMDRNAEEMRNLVGRFAPILVIVTVMVLTAVIWALSISWKLTLVALSGGPAILMAVKAFSYTSTRWETRCNRSAGDTSAVLTETFTNIRVVKNLTLEAYMGAKYDRSVRSTFKLGVRRAVYTSPLFGLYQCINFFLVALVFYYAMVLVAREFEANLVQIQQVCNLLLFCLGQAGSLLGTIPQIAASKATAAQMLYYVNLSDHNDKSSKEEEQGEGGTDAGAGAGAGPSPKKLPTPLPIRMRNLQFAYPSRPDVPVLRNLTLQIEAGTCTAIVGSSGCGKSTLISLIMSLYTPHRPASATTSISTPTATAKAELDPGSEKQPPMLSFHGTTPFWEVDAQHLRTMMAFVPQAPFLFPGTVAENIGYGLTEMSPLRSASNVRAAAAAAGIDEFVESLPEGYETVMGDGGQAVSGGQAQRICLARALARRLQVLVMDEPTSALDAETAEMVRGTIRGLVADPRRREMAVVLVTHSKEMMQLAERVVVLDGGRVVEEGGYEELRARGGEFARLIGGVQRTMEGLNRGGREKGECLKYLGINS